MAKLKGKCGKLSSSSSDFNGKYRQKATAAADSAAERLESKQGLNHDSPGGTRGTLFLFLK